MKLTLFAAAAMALCQAQPADLAADASTIIAVDLPTVIITGSMPLPAVDQPRDTLAAPVQTASAQQIARSGALDISAFLRYNTYIMPLWRNWQTQGT